MTVRAAVSIALALALLGASLPTVDSARVQHSESRVAAEVDRLERVATAFAVENAVVETGPTARATVRLHLPARSWGQRGLESFQIPAEGEVDVVWSVRGGPDHSRRFPSVRLVGDGAGLSIATGGPVGLELELRRRRDRRVVVVSRQTSNAGT